MYTNLDRTFTTYTYNIYNFEFYLIVGILFIKILHFYEIKYTTVYEDSLSRQPILTFYSWPSVIGISPICGDTPYYLLPRISVMVLPYILTVNLPIISVSSCIQMTILPFRFRNFWIRWPRPKYNKQRYRYDFRPRELKDTKGIWEYETPLLKV